MKNKKNNNPTEMIKCKFSNDVHRILEPNIGIKNSERWKNRDKYKFTDAQKLEMFNQILSIHKESSNELTAYQFDKREKKRIHAARVARGYKFKNKVTKEDYLNSLENKAAA